jgi:hypothetical protein
MDEERKIFYINDINDINNQENDKIYILSLVLFFLIIVFVFIKYFIIYSNKETFKLEPKKYNLSIMAIFKNEQDYMEEWLDYHIFQGFDKIYLYSNDPNINFYPYLKKSKYTPYIKIIDWVNKKNNGVDTIQRQAYTHCVQTYSQDSQFLLMLDLDEFIVPIKSYSKVSDYINSLKPQWNNICSFKIQRYDFGSSGHKTKPTDSVMTSYKLHEKVCSSFKTLVNTDYIDKSSKFWRVHDFNLIPNLSGKIYNSYLGYHETGFPNSCKLNSVNEIPLVINHYYTKSYEEYLTRCEMWKQGGINPIRFRQDCENKFKSRDVNEIEGY